MKNKLSFILLSTVLLASCSQSTASDVSLASSSQVESSVSKQEESQNSQETETTDSQDENAKSSSSEESENQNTATGQNNTTSDLADHSNELNLIQGLTIDTTYSVGANPGISSSVSIQETSPGQGILTVTGPIQATYNVQIERIDPTPVSYLGMGEPSEYTDNFDTRITISPEENTYNFSPLYLTKVTDANGNDQVKIALPLLMTLPTDSVSPDYQQALTYRVADL